jgi:hypothetical protein
MNYRIFFTPLALAAFVCLAVGCESAEVTAPSQDKIDSLQQEADPNAKEPKMEAPPASPGDVPGPPKR